MYFYEWVSDIGGSSKTGGLPRGGIRLTVLLCTILVTVVTTTVGKSSVLGKGTVETTQGTKLDLV